MYFVFVKSIKVVVLNVWQFFFKFVSRVQVRKLEVYKEKIQVDVTC